MYHLSGMNEPLGRFPTKFLEALALQERSLQYVKHIGGRFNEPCASANLSMATFLNLREMELVGPSPAGSGHFSVPWSGRGGGNWHPYPC